MIVMQQQCCSNARSNFSSHTSVSDRRCSSNINFNTNDTILMQVIQTLVNTFCHNNSTNKMVVKVVNVEIRESKLARKKTVISTNKISKNINQQHQIDKKKLREGATIKMNSSESEGANKTEMMVTVNGHHLQLSYCTDFIWIIDELTATKKARNVSKNNNKNRMKNIMKEKHRNCLLVLILIVDIL